MSDYHQYKDRIDRMVRDMTTDCDSLGDPTNVQRCLNHLTKASIDLDNAQQSGPVLSPPDFAGDQR